MREGNEQINHTTTFYWKIEKIDGRFVARGFWFDGLAGRSCEARDKDFPTEQGASRYLERIAPISPL
jgi:hypothetical protein